MSKIDPDGAIRDRILMAKSLGVAPDELEKLRPSQHIDMMDYFAELISESIYLVDESDISGIDTCE